MLVQRWRIDNTRVTSVQPMMADEAMTAVMVQLMERTTVTAT
jgi:hypothetical protein